MQYVYRCYLGAVKLPLLYTYPLPPQPRYSIINPPHSICLIFLMVLVNFVHLCQICECMNQPINFSSLSSSHTTYGIHKGCMSIFDVILTKCIYIHAFRNWVMTTYAISCTKSYEVWNISIQPTFSTEIWSPQISSWTQLVIWRYVLQMYCYFYIWLLCT